MTDEQPDSFIVPFDRRWLWRLFWTSLFMTVGCTGLAVFLTVARPPGTGTGALVLLLMYAVSYLLIPVGSVMTWWVSSKLVSRLPAFTADAHGISIHFAYQPQMRFGWKEVKSVVLGQVGPRPESLNLLFELDPQAYSREAGLLQRWTGKLSAHGTPVSIGLLLLDRRWPEIEEALNKLSEAYRWASMSDEDWEDFRAQFHQNIEKRLTLDGELVTLEQYKDRFRRRPVGCWSPAGEGFTRSPADQDVVFRDDNTGFFTEGAFHYPVEFVWLEKGECQVELQVAEDRFAVSYEIRDTQPPTLSFEEESGAFGFTLYPCVFGGLPQVFEQGDSARSDGSD